MEFPVRVPRRDGRRPLATFVDQPAPFLSVYLDVSAGGRRDSAKRRLLIALERIAVGGERSLTEAQRAVAEEVLDLVQPSDGTLVMVADADGDALVTGYPSVPPNDLVAVADLPILAPLLLAEQSRLHHLVAVVAEGQLTLVVVPRHGEPVHRTLPMADPNEIVTTIGRSALETDTSLVLVSAEADQAAWIESRLRSMLPEATGVAPVAAMRRDIEELAAEILDSVAGWAAARERDIARFWALHRASDQVVEGPVDTNRLLTGGGASLALVVDDRLRSMPRGPQAHVDGVVATAIRARIPVVVVRPGLVTADADVGAVSADRIDAAQVSRWLER